MYSYHTLLIFSLMQTEFLYTWLCISRNAWRNCKNALIRTRDSRRCTCLPSPNSTFLVSRDFLLIQFTLSHPVPKKQVSNLILILFEQEKSNTVCRGFVALSMIHWFCACLLFLFYGMIKICHWCFAYCWFDFQHI